MSFRNPARAYSACANSAQRIVALLGKQVQVKTDGCEVARRLRQLPGLGSVVLVAVTGYADEAHRRQCDGAGFAFYVVKPAIPEELEGLLGALARVKGDPTAG